MAPLTQQPLLSSTPPGRRTSIACKALLVLLSLVAVISLAITLFTLQQSTNTILQPSDLCIQSPNQASCQAIVSETLSAAGNTRTRPAHVLTSIIDRSLLRIDTAIAAAGGIQRRINEPRQQAALSDCLHLLDLSRDRLTGSAWAISKGANADANAWLSAVLTNHVTCLDGLDGDARQPMQVELDSLMSLASASLAVLNAVAPPKKNEDAVAAPVIKFPAWLSHRERKLLESSGNAVQANVVVAADGSGSYKTVQEAVNAAPNGGTSRYVIYVKKGIYKEIVSIGKTKKNLMIVGDGMDATVITGSLNVIDGSTTFNSATVAAVGDGLILQDLKIENTAGAIKHQAVALRVGADQSVINRCNIAAYQDTLYTHSLRQFYRDSTISGTVDFIFGNAAVVLQNCILMARRPMDNQQNLVTAQGRTDPNQNTGTSIQNCQIVPSSDLAPVKGQIPTYLGRPWMQYSRTVVMQSFIDSHVSPKGWLEWDGSFALSTLFYGEYLNKGPGAGTGGRVNWPGYHVITDANVASSFTVAGLIQGGAWLKSTGVAFTEGL